MLNIQDLVSGGESAIEELVLIEEQEGLQLEFKANPDGGADSIFRGGKLTRHGNKSLGKEISAFANSAGGIIIVGVDCRQKDGINCARALSQVSDIDAAFTAISHQIGNMIQPSVDGLEIDKIASEHKSGSGYLLIKVPRSERRPHQCTATHAYYKRAGTSSIVMEHYDVEDAFSRSGSPDLRLSHSLKLGPGGVRRGGTRFRIACEVHAKNLGVATAKKLSFFSLNDPGFEYAFTDPSGVAPVYSVVSEWRQLTVSDMIFLHPSEERVIATIAFSVSIEGDGITKMHVCKDASVIDYNFPYKLFAENMRSRDGEIYFSISEIEKIIAPHKGV